MSTETSRDDFIIAIRSAFLKKGNRQKFSLFTLLIISILVLSLEYFRPGPVNQFRSITKDIIFRGSYVVSSPFKYLKDKDFKKMRSWVVNNIDTDASAIFRLLYDNMNDKVKPQSIPQLILILADYQYKNAFVADHELNVVACLTEIMANVEFK